jgi:hypothetical protein
MIAENTESAQLAPCHGNNQYPRTALDSIYEPLDLMMRAGLALILHVSRILPDMHGLWLIWANSPA